MPMPEKSAPLSLTRPQSAAATIHNLRLIYSGTNWSIRLRTTAIRLWEIVRFAAAGTPGNILHGMLLYVLTEYARIWYIASSLIAFSITIMITFIIQKFWTFESNGIEMIGWQLFQYVVLRIVITAATTSGLYVLVEYLHAWYMLAYIVMMLVVGAPNYLITKRILNPTARR